MKTFTTALLMMIALAPLSSAHAAEKNEKASELPALHHLVIYVGTGISQSSDTDARLLQATAKIGYDVGSLGNFARLVPMLSYSSGSQPDFMGVGTTDNNATEVQLNFRNVLGTGLYFGPSIGHKSITVSTSLFGNFNQSTTQSFTTVGAFVGYEFFKASVVSFSPEVQVGHYGSANDYKVLLGMNINLF